MGSQRLSHREAATWVVFDMQGQGDVLRMVPRTLPDNQCQAIAELVTSVLYWRGVKMTRTEKKAADAGNSQWTTFVDIPLAGYTKGDVNERYGTWGDFDADLATLLSAGYRVGISYSEKQGAFIVSITCRDAASANHGYTFSSFAADWVTALQVALFKHFVVAAEVWSTPTPRKNDDLIG